MSDGDRAGAGAIESGEVGPMFSSAPGMERGALAEATVSSGVGSGSCSWTIGVEEGVVVAGGVVSVAGGVVSTDGGSRVGGGGVLSVVGSSVW